MSEHAAYHALGQGEQYDPNDPRRTTQPAPPQFQPPIAQHPYHQQQQQYGSPASPGQGQGQHPYGSPPIGGASPAGAMPGFAPPAGDGAGLASQMAGMSLDGQHTTRKKKKDRHAFHTVEAPAGSSQPYNGIPPAGTPATAFLNADPLATTGGQFLGPPVSPNPFSNPTAGAYGPPSPNQFPAPVNAPYNPASPATPAEFAARAGQPQAPGLVAATGGGGVSPDEMPSVPVSRDIPQQYYLSNVYPTFERHVPPPATVSFVAYDQGNSSPKFTRLTMNNIPATAESLSSTGLPLGLVLQPLAPLQAGELEIPVLDFGDQGPPRCRRCRAYINPFMMFTFGGSKFVCNLCTYPNDTPPEYFCATTPQGARSDRDQRPEQTRGTVEFTVPKEYWTKEPTGLNWLFVIDVTQEAFNKGFLEAFCEGILSALYAPEAGSGTDDDGEPKRQVPPGAKVGFVTYDKDVHFYNCNVSFQHPRMPLGRAEISYLHSPARA